MKLPCKDCITLSVCKASFKDIDGTYVNAAHNLYNKCSILEEYLNSYYCSNHDVIHYDSSIAICSISVKSVISFFVPTQQSPALIAAFRKIL